MDSQTEQTCAEWCRSHYWQLQEKRGWRYAFHESVMVRYYEEANLDPALLEPLVEFLKGDGWQGSFTVHNKPMDATGWKTRDVWYETRDGDVKEATKLKRTRIYHAVYKEGDEQGGDGPYVVEDGCKWKVSHEFYWKVESLPELPESGSGVQYRLQGVARDDETGLWNCVIEKRETIQQDVPCYESAETTFEKRYDEQHLGVKQQNVQATGQLASAGGGVMVRRELRKNEDCTTDVINETVQEKPVSGAVSETTRTQRGTRTVTVNRNQASKAELGDGEGSVRNEQTDGGLWNQTITTFARIAGWFRRVCRKTKFLHEHAVTEAVEADPGFTHVTEAAGGVVTEKSVTRNDEGGFDVETRTREEQNVPRAVVETRKFVDGVTVTTVNRGQPDEASAAGLAIGESVRNERTEGGLVDQTIVQASVEPVGRTGEACEQNALVHAHSRTEGMGTESQSAEVEQVPGQVNTRRVRRTERGAWEVTDETRTAKPAEAEATGGSIGRTVVVRSLRNQQSIDPGPGGVNEEIDANAQPNEFGLVDGTVRTTTYEPQTATGTGAGSDTTVTIEVGRNTLSSSVSESGGVNQTVDVNVTPNDHGSYDYTKRKTTFTPKTATGVGTGSDSTTTIEVGRNTESANVSDTGGVNTAVEVHVTPNDHGSYDYTKRKTTFTPKTATGVGTGSDSTTTIEVGRNTESANVSDTGGVNTAVEVHVTPNDHGSYDYTKRKTTFTPKTATGVGTGSDSTTTIEVGRNTLESSVADAGGVNEAVEVHVTPNDHGSYDYIKRKTTFTPKTATGVGTGSDTTTTIEVGRNTLESSVSESGGVNTSVDINIVPNDHGSYDYTKRKTTFKPKVATGSSTGTVVDTEVEVGRNTLSSHVGGGAGVNQAVEVNITPNDHGSYDYRKTTHTYHEKSATATGGNMLATVETTVKENAAEEASESPSVGTVWDVSAQPNDHGTKRIVKTRRTAKAQLRTYTWIDQRKSATGYTVYQNKLVVFRNMEEMPVEGGWETSSPSMGINEYGLLDGTIHYQKLLREEKVDAQPGDGGMIYSGTIKVKDKKGYVESVKFTTYRNARGCISSGFLNGAVDYPHLGLHSSDSGTSGIKYE